MMISSKKVLARFAANTAERMLKRNANSTSCVVMFQPSIPKNLKDYKRKPEK